MARNAASKRTTSSSRNQNRSEALEKQILGVPARIMRPRLIFIIVVAALVFFGFVMIYSASSVKALSSTGNAAYYLIRQMGCAFAGLLTAIFIAHFDYHNIKNPIIFHLLWGATLLALVAVWVLGDSTNGASRWIEIFGVRLQPSEFAKTPIVLGAACIASDYYSERSINLGQAVVRSLIYIGIPVGLIVIQPDKGTAGIIVAMVFAVLYYAGFPRDVLVKLLGFLGVIALVISLADDYSRQRILTMIDPSSDPYDTGYQLNQGFIAFGSGGLFGVGLGMSRQKYSYLPEAHNDFIFAIIGEELGLVGTLLVLAAFIIIIYEAIQIARQAPDLLGRLIVVGSITLITVQAFINILGVLGMFPLSGKPLPFLSYGGSAIWGELMLVGLIINVSKRSKLPETAYDRRRQAMSLAEEEDTGVSEAYARGSAPRGSLQLQSFDPSAQRPSKGLRLIEGGSSDMDASRQTSYKRKNLGPSAADRLRNNDSGSKGSSQRSRGSRKRS